jgi:5S rRNA maturation endonuclease (ribonuclease M5)
MKKIPTNVPEVLDVLGIQIASEGNQEITAHCPFHEDHHPSFSINKDTGLWICFQCGERGNLEHLLQKIKRGSSSRLLQSVRRQSVGRGLRRTESAQSGSGVVRRDRLDPVPEIDPLLVYAQYESFDLPPPWACENRQLESGAVERFGIRWNKGWVIPIWTPEPAGSPRDLWGWQFKRLDFVRNEPVGVKKSRTLFGLREFTGSTAILVESPLDVVRMASVGVTGALASFGAMVSNTQLQILTERAERIVVALDNDQEGKKQARKITRILNRVLPTEIFTYYSSVKDPGEMDDEELIEEFSFCSKAR